MSDTPKTDELERAWYEWQNVCPNDEDSPPQAWPDLCRRLEKNLGTRTWQIQTIEPLYKSAVEEWNMVLEREKYLAECLSSLLENCRHLPSEWYHRMDYNLNRSKDALESREMEMKAK